MKDNKKTSPNLNFFFGKLDSKSIYPYPKLNDEQKDFGKALIDAVSKYFESVDSEHLDKESLIPDEIYNDLKELGLYGLGVSEDLGGLNLDYSLYARVFSEVCGNDAAIATMLGAHQSIGYRPLIIAGSDEQKNKWLPQLASGDKIASFCLTEPGSGSDAYSIKTKAVKDKNGNYILNGQKLWITNGGKADFYSVFAKTSHIINGKEVEKISCFIVEKEMDGVTFGSKEDKMGIRASETRAVFFENVKIPKENLIGEEGKGFKLAMMVLNSGRLSLGSGCVGGMKQLLKLATEHANSRHQFGKPIKDFGLIQEKLAYMAARCYATESIVYLSTSLIDQGLHDYQLESAICKVYGSESLWKVVDQAMQVAAGNGYMKEYPYERIMRDSRINLIFEGTNEILRVFIALSGLNELGKEYKSLSKLKDFNSFLKDPIKSVGVLSDFASNRLNKNFIKSFENINEKLSEENDKLAKMISKFSLKSEDILLKHGKKIIGNEFLQGRISNMCINLYVYLATLSRTASILDDETINEEDKDYCFNLCKIILKESRGEFMRNLKQLDTNLDKLIINTSESVSKRNGYGLDIINF